MKYILDYDLTLSDYSRFVADSKPYRDDGSWVTPAIWDILDAKNYLYDDVLPFLKTHTKEDIKILTAMTPSLGPEARAFQKVKLERSGIMEFVDDVVFMEGDKGPYIQEMYSKEATVFVDDKLEHLLSAKQHCPAVQVVQMIRPGMEAIVDRDETIPTITSLQGLDNLL